MYGPARANSDVIASVIASAKQEEVGTKGEREFQLLRYHPGGGGGGGGGEDSHMKQTVMLVVSLRGVNFGFWSRLGCSGQSANILSRQGLV